MSETKAGSTERLLEGLNHAAAILNQPLISEEVSDHSEAHDRLKAIKRLCDLLTNQAEAFERRDDTTSLKYLHKRLVNLLLEVDPTYSIGINGPPDTEMGSTAMSEQQEADDAKQPRR